MTRRALITGITGQDGFYLADLLLSENYEVHGMLRMGQSPDGERIASLADRIVFHEADLCDQSSLVRLLDEARPEEIYNLAGESFVPDSWRDPVQTCNVMGLGVTRLLEAIRIVDERIRFCQASSSEIFGRTAASPQNEQTPLAPCNPYGAAKALAHWTTTTFRQGYGLFACSAIAFNHESPLRNARFVPRKITEAAARIKLGLQDRLMLGNMAAERDWGFAGDYVRAMWMMLQRDTPEDFVLATGAKRSVRELARAAFSCVDLDYRDFVQVDSSLLRRNDVNTLLGDITKARRELGWEPTISFEQLIQMMVEADLARIKHEAARQVT